MGENIEMWHRYLLTEGHFCPKCKERKGGAQELCDEIDRLEAEVAELKAELREGVEYVEEARPGETVWLERVCGLLEE